MTVETLSDLVFHVRTVSAGRPALLSIKRRRRLETVSTAEFLSGVHSLALALESRGLKAGERVALISENCPEWHMIDFACQLVGAVTVPIYPTLLGEQVGYILRNSGAAWVFYSDSQKRDLLAAQRDKISRQLSLVAIDETAALPDGLSLVPLLGEGARRASDQPLERFRGRVKASDLASIIYTSGTTGEPKGVMLTHENFVSNFLACEPIFNLGPADVGLSFLPLSHVFERTVDHLFFYCSVAIHYAPSIDRVPPLLEEIKPTVLTSVPRLYERAFLRATAQAAKESPRRQKFFHWAIAIGKRYAFVRRRRIAGPWLLLRRAIADRFVFRRIRARFGGRLRIAISGGAPLHPAVAEFWEAIGIALYEGYGLTEAAPVLAVNSPAAHRIGSVGRAIDGVTLRIASDGEVLARGRGIMRGYWENSEATAEVLDDNGWLRTGDIGQLDEEGFLFITDRKKDLIVTSGGKNIAPAPIEQLLTSHSAIGQAVVVGDNYPYLTALLVPRYEDLPESLRSLDPKELRQNSEMLRLAKEAVDQTNAKLAEHERVRRHTLLDRELSMAEGELTPTLKVRRRVVLERYSEQISSMYLKTQKVG